NETPALALCAEAEILKLDDDGDGETVINGRITYVGGGDTRLLERDPTRSRGGARRQVEIAAAAMLDRFSGADQLHARPVEPACDLRAGCDHRAAAIADDAAVQPVQRRRHERRRKNVVDGDDLAQHRIGIEMRMVRSGDLDPGELLARRAEL